MGVGCYECGLGSGYNMDSEATQDHAVVNAQNMAVTVGLTICLELDTALTMNALFQWM